MCVYVQLTDGYGGFCVGWRGFCAVCQGALHGHRVLLGHLPGVEVRTHKTRNLDSQLCPPAVSVTHVHGYCV